MAAELAAPSRSAPRARPACTGWPRSRSARSATATASSAIPAFRGVRAEPLHGPARDPAPRRLDRPRARDAVGGASASVFPEKPTTTHFSVVDGDGMVVAVTTTLERLLRQRPRRSRPRLPLEQRDGRLRHAPGREEHVRPRPGRGQRGRARQADALLDVPVDRRAAAAAASFAWGIAGRLDDPDDEPPGPARPRPARPEPRRRRSPRRASTSRTCPTSSKSRRTASTPPGSRRSRRWATPSGQRARPRPGRSGASTPSRRCPAESPRPSPIRARQRRRPRRAARRRERGGPLFGRSTARGAILRLLDQRRLPAEEVWLSLERAPEIALAIRDMAVRGAPAIGVAAAYGAAFALRSGGTTPPAERFATARRLLAATRPTAVNLFAALERMERRFAGAAAPSPGGDRGGARRRGRRDRRRGHRGLPPHRALRRGAADGRARRPHPLQRGRARDRRLRHGARRDPRRGRGGKADPRPRRRDAARSSRARG